MFFLIKGEEKTMISLAMQLLKAEQGGEVFQILIFRVPFLIFSVQIFLKIFLMDLEEQEAGVEKNLRT